jgi:murein DD-endopeptidase MepM/ murein hydrolase activator NlpD
LRFPLDDAALWRGYGPTRRGRRRHNHLGVDLGAAPGTPFRAADRGLVAYVGNDLRGYGNVALVVHPGGAVTLYAHARALYVRAGALVARGQVLGEVGDTGFARGAHLHFEVHEDGAARNPLPRFASLPARIALPASALDDRILPPDPSVRHRPARGRRSQVVGGRVPARGRRPADTPRPPTRVNPPSRSRTPVHARPAASRGDARGIRGVRQIDDVARSSQGHPARTAARPPRPTSTPEGGVPR